MSDHDHNHEMLYAEPDPHTHELIPSNYYYYALSEVLLCFEHDPAWLRNPNNEPITSQQVYELLQNRELIPGSMQGVELDLSAVGVRLEAEGKRVQSFFSCRGKPGTLNVAKVTSDFNNFIQEHGEPKEYRNKEGEERVFTKILRVEDTNDKAGFLQMAMPNWYSGASPHIGLGTHGPGRKPRPVRNADKPQKRVFKFETPFKNKVASFVPPAKCAKEVDVFILDTIPPVVRLENALVDFPLLYPYEAILAEKLPATGVRADRIYETDKANYYYAAESAFAQTNDPNSPGYHPIVIEGHNYDSSDHGLFIAGIIHKIAPQAHLHVIEIMNNLGIGTFWNIADGFKRVLALHPPNSQRAAIINCSLTLAFPTTLQYGYNPDFTDTGLEDFIRTAADPEFANNPLEVLVNQLTCEELDTFHAALQVLVDGTIELFSDVIDNFYNGVLIISASGNDSDRDHGVVRPARYLAKTEFSTGVGALNIAKKIASYSNENDTPPIEGFYVFGGDYTDGIEKLDHNGRPIYRKEHVDKDGNTVKEGGIIGIFLAPFETLCNLNGYAEWAGTSFAAPVLSGTIAHACLETCKTPQAVQSDIVRGVSAKVTPLKIRAQKIVPQPAKSFYEFLHVKQEEE